MRRFHLPAPWSVGETVALPPDEARHLRTVLRGRAGERIALVDGAGGLGEAELTLVDRHGARCRILTRTTVPPDAAMQLRLAVAPPKGSRWDDLARMLAELGVGTLQPLRSARGCRDAGSARTERVAIEAGKQCGRAHLMQIRPPVGFADLAAAGERLILLDPDGGPALPGAVRPTTLVVGPEGGLTDEERRLLAGAERVRLAPHILRIETAAVAAAATWIAAWEHHERNVDHP